MGEKTELWRRVVLGLALIDFDAMLFVINESKDRLGDGTLGGLFVWGDTPQGHNYWAELERQLRELGVYDE